MLNSSCIIIFESYQFYMFLQVVEAEPGEGLVQAPLDVVDIEAPVTETLTNN